jgi:hypothetical protein
LGCYDHFTLTMIFVIIRLYVDSFPPSHVGAFLKGFTCASLGCAG